MWVWKLSQLESCSVLNYLMSSSPISQAWDGNIWPLVSAKLILCEAVKNHKDKNPHVTKEAEIKILSNTWKNFCLSKRVWNVWSRLECLIKKISLRKSFFSCEDFLFLGFSWKIFMKRKCPWMKKETIR